MSNNPLGELANLKQTGTVEEYQSQFQSLLARISDLKPRQQVDLFTAGLVEDLRIDIKMQQPGNLGVAMNMARTLERKQKASSKLSSRTNLNWPTSPNIGNNPTIPTTKSFNAKGEGQLAKPVGNSSKVGSSAPFIKRLTRIEMAERRAKGLCYNCDESYSLGHKCKRLFWIEVPDYEGEQDNDEVDNLEVSLHAISGTRNSSTMQLIAKEYKGPQPAAVGDLPLVCDGKALPTPQAILRSRLNRVQQELLVQWAGCSQEDATWEPFEVLHAAYPEFELEDKLNPRWEILDTNPQLFFHLQQQRLIELIRNGKIEEALEFSQEELAPRGEENQSFLEELERTVSLLAFEDVSNCPVGELLDISQ
ncbi:hypothetical protein V6N12_011317 [Hibiscus sabdariffa]